MQKRFLVLLLLFLLFALVVVLVVVRAVRAVLVVSRVVVVLSIGQRLDDLCEKFSNNIVFGKGNRKTRARTLCFLSEAVLGRRRSEGRPGGT